MEFVFSLRSQYMWMLPVGGPAHCHRSGGREDGTTMVGMGIGKDAGVVQALKRQVSGC